MPSEIIDVVLDATRLFSVGDRDVPDAPHSDGAIVAPLTGRPEFGAGIDAREIVAGAFVT